MTLDEQFTLKDFQSNFVTRKSKLPILHFQQGYFAMRGKRYFDLNLLLDFQWLDVNMTNITRISLKKIFDWMTRSFRG